MFMRNLTEKKLPILRTRAANLAPVSARLRQAEEAAIPGCAKMPEKWGWERRSFCALLA